MTKQISNGVKEEIYADNKNLIIKLSVPLETHRYNPYDESEGDKMGGGKYKAIVCIDGIDRKKAAEMTNALRLRGISLELVKSRKDESEPIIRLADMWAGCVRNAISKKFIRKQSHFINRLRKERSGGHM